MKFVSIEKVSAHQSRIIRIIIIGLIIFSLMSVYFYPLNLLNRFFPGLMREDSSCIFLNLTGIPCAFCGMSHAFRELTGFNFLKSIYYNPSSVFVFAFSGITVLLIFVLSLFNYKLTVNFNRKTFFISALIFLAIWILNIFYGHH